MESMTLGRRGGFRGKVSLGTGSVDWLRWGGGGGSPVLLPVAGPLGLVGLDASDVVGRASLQRGHQVIGLFLRWGEKMGMGGHR